MSPILQSKRNFWRTAQVSQTGLLIDGRDYYKAFYETAAQAKHTILMAGWQFNSDVRLLRGEDAATCDTDVRLLPYLNSLCERNPELHIYILAWDFLEFFAFQREWHQPKLFGQSKTKRIQFLYDSRHAIGASHHQKMVVIDGELAFVGGMDICRERWSERHHMTHQQRKTPCDPRESIFHDIQSYHTGPAVRWFVQLFRREWMRAGGGKLELPRPKPERPIQFEPSATFSTNRVAICRTQSRTLLPPQRAVTEIRQLYVDAIRAAEKFIYIENQYFTSKAVLRALLERMRKKEHPSLQIVLVLPPIMKTWTEDLVLGLTQARMLRALKRAAEKTGHAVGIYYSTTRGTNGAALPKLIHSKLMLIDDRFLTVGSANTANRSMGLDTELNVAWEASDQRFSLDLQRMRVDLLSEHAGVAVDEGARRFSEGATLVRSLNDAASSPQFTLQHHRMATRFHRLNILRSITTTLDPERPPVEEKIAGWISDHRRLLRNLFNIRKAIWGP